MAGLRVLVAEDDPTSVLVLRRILEKAGYSITVARDGQEAIDILTGDSSFDALLTDWMMPRVDGIALIRKVHEVFHPSPPILMLTAMDSPEAKLYALSSGADELVGKPYDSEDLLERLKNCIARKVQAESRSLPAPQAKVSKLSPKTPSLHRAPFPALFVAASTGGPDTLVRFFKGLPKGFRGSVFVVLHGPAWAIETFAGRLGRETSLPVCVAQDRMVPAEGRIYLAPGDRHMIVSGSPLQIRIKDGPPENFVRPAADPLFRSAAEVFGARAVGVVLTGLGRDGMEGAGALSEVGGAVFVQDPKEAVAASMPRSVLDRGIPASVFSVDKMPQEILRSLSTV